ncbi:orotidine 5'-phosphate decarboxylase [bacterium MnTg02]|nr:orotidine 5'-phosphate decarboxylase [bacterium MnTg02]
MVKARNQTLLDSLQPKDRLIIALDVPTPDDAQSLIHTLGDAVSIYKIGLELLLAGGTGLAEELIGAGKQVFIDAKLLDIGNTVERAAANIAKLGATFLTIHGTDRKTLDAAVRGRGTSDLKLLAITVLTNLSQSDLTEQGIGMTPEDLVLRRAKLAADAGFDGVVASAREAQNIRAQFPDLIITTPGIRPAGADAGDQARTMTPGRAIAAGADFLVVGRPVTRAPDPRHAAKAIIAEIADALQ